MSARRMQGSYFMNEKAKEIWESNPEEQRISLFLDYHRALGKKLKALRKKSVQIFQLFQFMMNKFLIFFSQGTHRAFVAAVCFLERLVDQALSTLKTQR